MDPRFTPISSQEPVSSSVINDAIYKTEHFTYRLLAVQLDGQGVSWYLYASDSDAEQSDRVDWVLGVFDTCGQLSFFLDLHLDNELKVPALKLAPDNRFLGVDGEGRFCFPMYAGVYRVGFKSYTVDICPDSLEKRIVHYIQSYKTEYLGLFENEKEACLGIYSHFDNRLRGCKMC